VILDASALVAIVREEKEADDFLDVIGRAIAPKMSAASYLEASIVVDGAKDAVASRRLDDFVARAGIDIAPFTDAQARLARQAYRDYGKGSGHPARLNFGDCIAYALAKATGEPLLYKGDDFALTDVTAAV
jgi:ribonuclease VapC